MMEPTLLADTTSGLYQRPSTSTTIGCQYLQYRGSEDPDDDESEAVSLELNVSRMDHHIKELQQGKKTQLRRLNTLRSATRNLPPETLILIFHHVATPITHSTFLDYARNPRFPMYMERNISIIRCASVSSLWRDLILSTPSLWTTLALRIRPNDQRIKIQLMELLWMRSQNLPVLVDLGFERLQGSDGVPTLAEDKTIIDLFSLGKNNADRFSMLRLRSPPMSLARHIVASSSTHRLQYLSLENMDGRDSRPITLSNLPRLHQLTLRNIRGKIRVKQNNISVLDFIETSLAGCIGILKRCPNVVEVHCRFPKLSRDISDNDSGSMLAFPSLEKFTWTLSDNSINLAFIQRLALPALKMLRLYGDADHIDSISPISAQPIIQFFHQLSPNLEELELVNWKEWTSGGLAQLVGHVYNTKKLVLRECFETFNLDMVKLLSLAQTQSVDEQYLPRLEMLSIQSAKTRAYLELLPDLMNQRALKSSRMRPFRLEVSRPEASTVQLLEAVAVINNGNVKLEFLENF